MKGVKSKNTIYSLELEDRSRITELINKLIYASVKSGFDYFLVLLAGWLH